MLGASTRLGTTVTGRTTRNVAERRAEDSGGVGGLPGGVLVRRRDGTTKTPSSRRLAVTHAAYDYSRSLAVRLLFPLLCSRFLLRYFTALLRRERDEHRTIQGETVLFSP